MKEFNNRYWLRFSFFNLLIVALFGGMMRYKIGFSFPWLEQDYLHHAHSHFAFSGWVSQTLFVFIIDILTKNNSEINIKKYEHLLAANLFISYAMLISFSIQGYNIFSIIFSTLSIVVTCLFSFYYYKDTKQRSFQSKKWFDSALLFNIISTLGTFSLVFMMATKSFDQHLYLASVYWYLHFQYNGWFFFACIGLLIHFLNINNYLINDKIIFRLLLISCIPLYMLSVLWLNPPLWIYLLTGTAAIMQLYAWISLIQKIQKLNVFHIKESKFSRSIFLFCTLAGTLKMLLQFGSAIPTLSHLAFGSRSVIIAYLHLVLLAFISVFLIACCELNKLLATTSINRRGIQLFLIGIFVNEVLLAIQGFASFSYTVIPFVNEMLFMASLIIIAGLLIINYQQRNIIKHDIAHL